MTELKKPEEMSPKGFCELVEKSLLGRSGYSRRRGSGIIRQGPQKAFAIEASVSPTVIGEICRGEFPAPQSPDTRPYVRERRLAGEVFSLTRICDVLGLDLDACLEACGLPKLALVIERSREKAKTPTLERNDLEMLLRASEIFGSLPLPFALTLVEQHRSKQP